MFLNNESVEKLFSERNFQISREGNEEGLLAVSFRRNEEGILGHSLREENLFSSKYADDRRIFRSRKMEIAVER